MSSGKKYYKLVIFACFFLYVSMMAAKSVFTAELVEIIGVFNTTKAQASIANTLYFMTYAAVQILLVFIIGKLNIKRYLFVTVVLSGALTILMGFSPRLEYIWVLSAINGALQAGVWAGCMSVLSAYVPKEKLAFANKLMSAGFAIGNTVSYAVSALCVEVLDWTVPFIALGAVFVASAVVFLVIIGKGKRYAVGAAETEHAEKTEEKTLFALTSKRDKFIFYAAEIFFLFMFTFCYYATMNYLPSFLNEVFGIPESYSIFISVLGPIAITVGPIIIINSCEKHFNFVAVACVCSVISCIPILYLSLFCRFNVILSLIFFVMFVIEMRAVTNVNGVINFKMRSVLNIGAHSASTNALASAAASVAPVVMGILIDRINWEYSFLVLFGIVALCTVLLAIILILMRGGNGIGKIKNTENAENTKKADC